MFCKRQNTTELIQLLLWSRSDKSYFPFQILTASHCVRGKSSLNVVAGAHDKSQRESTQQKISSKRIIMHPSYTGSNLNYDVALVELSEPLKMNDRVVRACLPQSGVYPQVGKNCYVAGEILNF